MINSVKKCQLVILQDQLFYEMNLTMLNQNNNFEYDSNLRNVHPLNMPNHKEIIQKKASDKKINSATNHVYEKQHNELTIKSKTDSLPQDSNNIRVQTRLQSEKKQNTEDIIDKCLNDSKYKKSQIQKVEKLDIKIKEKLEIDTRNTMKNKATEDQNKVLKDLQDKVFFDLKEKLSENNLNSEDKY